jgi:hypothetical protein
MAMIAVCGFPSHFMTVPEPEGTWKLSHFVVIAMLAIYCEVNWL